ncbi:MAG: integration host factor, actinobacterial type [Mycobacteriales bacterium]
MSLPPLTADQRAAALHAAAAARRTRAEVKERLKRGGASLTDVLDAAESDPILGKLRVAELIESMPGVGKARAEQIMRRLAISPSRRLRGLGCKQREALLGRFAPTGE